MYDTEHSKPVHWDNPEGCDREGGERGFLMKVKEETGKAHLNLSIQKTKTIASGLITSWPIDGRK